MLVPRLHCPEQNLGLVKYHAKQTQPFLAQGDGRRCGGDVEIGYLQAAKVPGTRPFPIASFLSEMIINSTLCENFSQSLDLYAMHLIIPIPSIRHPDLLRISLGKSRNPISGAWGKGICKRMTQFARKEKKKNVFRGVVQFPKSFFVK
jgi:hypothetical protein